MYLCIYINFFRDSIVLILFNALCYEEVKEEKVGFSYEVVRGILKILKIKSKHFWTHRASCSVVGAGNAAAVLEGALLSAAIEGGIANA